MSNDKYVANELRKYSVDTRQVDYTMMSVIKDSTGATFSLQLFIEIIKNLADKIDPQPIEMLLCNENSTEGKWQECDCDTDDRCPSAISVKEVRNG